MVLSYIIEPNKFYVREPFKSELRFRNVLERFRTVDVSVYSGIPKNLLKWFKRIVGYKVRS